MAALFWRPLAAGHAWGDSVWSTSDSGAAGTLAPPTAADTATFSSNDTSNCAVSAAAVVLDLSFTGGTGYTGTFSGASALTVSGSFTLSAGVTWTYTGLITCNATAIGKTFTTAGITLASDITFNGAGGGWTLQDNLTTGVTNTVSAIAGTFSTNAKTVNAGFFSTASRSSSVALTLTITNSTLNLSASGASGSSRALAWNMGFGVVTNFTRNFTGSTINLTGSNVDFRGDNLTYATVVINGGGDSILENNNTYGTLSIIGTSSFSRIKLSGNFTVSGTLTLTGNSQNASRLLVMSNVLATVTTITAAAVSLTNVDFTSVTGAGAATWSGTSLGDCGGNTNITFTAPVNRFWVGNGGSWSDTSHWSASTGGAGGATMPLAQDSAFIDANSITIAGQTISTDTPSYGNIDFTGVLNSPTLNSVIITQTQHLIYGNLTLAAAMTWTGGGDWIWSHQSGTKTLTTNGVSLSTSSIKMVAPGGTISLGDDLTIGGVVVFQGTFTANNKNVTVTQFGVFCTGTLTRVFTLGTGTWTIRDPSIPTGFMWSAASSGMTFNSAGSKIILQRLTPSGTVFFAGGGLTYNNVTWADESSSQGLTITGANTFNDLNVAASTQPRALTLPAGATTTATTVELNGGSPNSLLTVQSSSPGTQATLSVASGIVTAQYVALRDIAATGGAIFQAKKAKNLGNNSGWNIQSLGGLIRVHGRMLPL